MDVSKVGGLNLNIMANNAITKKGVVRENTIAFQGRTDNNERGIEINISDEARQLLRRKSSDDDSFLASRDIAKIIAEGEAKGKEIEADTSGSLGISPDDPLYERYGKEILNEISFNKGVGLDSVSKFSTVAAKYTEMRKGIEEKYSGEELTGQLQTLDEGYDYAINEMAKFAEMEIKSAAMIYEFRVRANNELVEHGKTHGHTFGIDVKDTVTYDKKAFNESIALLARQVTDSIKHFGALSKQYMLDGNAAPVSEEEKANFTAYISQGVDESKGLYSLDTLDLLEPILNPTSNGGKGAQYDALEKLTDSGISDSLKAVIIRMTTQTDRMFNIVPDAYKETEQALYDLMSKSDLSL